VHGSKPKVLLFFSSRGFSAGQNGSKKTTPVSGLGLSSPNNNVLPEIPQ